MRGLLRLAAPAACVLLNLGCPAAETLAPNEVSVDVTTHGPDQDPNGYRVELHDAQGMLRDEAIGTNDAIHIQIYRQGIFDVLLTDIAANCTAAVNPQQAFAPQWSVDFDVTCVANVGTAKIEVTTTGTAYTNQYLVLVDWTTPVPTGTTAEQTVTSVPVGQRTATLSNVPDHCTTTTATVAAVVAYNQETTFHFDVTCAANRVLDAVMATTGGLPDADGYTVTARFVVNGVQIVRDQVAAIDATVRFADLAHYAVELAVSGLAANCTVANNPRTVTPPATGVGTETFSPHCPAPPVFHPLTIVIQAAFGTSVSIVADAAPLACSALQCAANILEGSLVNLALTPGTGSVINAILGDCVPGAGGISATVLMNAPRTCTVVVGAAVLLGLRHLATLNYAWNGDALLKKLLGIPAASRRSAGRRTASATLLVAARVPNPKNGSAPVIEYNLDDPSSPVEVSDGGLCGVRTMVLAQDPAVGPMLYGFSGDAPWSCLTGYPPGGAIGLFNFGSTAGEALTLPNDPSHILVGGLDGYLRRMPLGGNTTFHQLVTSQVTCLGDLALHGSTLLIAGREGTVGTSTENCNNHRGLFRFDLATNAVTGFVNLGGQPRDVALSSDGSRAYVADYSGNAIHVVDVAAMSLVRSIPMSGGPVTLALTPDGAHLLVGLWDANELRMVDLANDQVVDTESSRGVRPASLVLIDNVAALMNFGDPSPVTGTGSTLALFEFSTGATSASGPLVRSRRR